MISLFLTIGLLIQVGGSVESIYEKVHRANIRHLQPPLPLFWDEIHSTGSGNRMLAFNVMEKIRQINFKEKTIIRKNKSMTLDKKELEIECLKSVVSSKKSSSKMDECTGRFLV